MNDDLIEHYRALLAQHGPSAHAVQYSDATTQQARFAVLAGIAPDLGRVLDVGCGLCHLHGFLNGRVPFSAYHGVDIVPEFIALANAAMAGDPRAHASLIAPDADLPPCDHALLSGVFNNRMPDNWGFMTATLRRMWAAADKGIAFNAMTSHVDYRDEGLYYVDPMQVIAFCKTELGGHPVLRHDYSVRPGGFPFEFAVYLYKQPVYPLG
jgi:SAM-dependent methyltransferase